MRTLPFIVSLFLVAGCSRTENDLIGAVKGRDSASVEDLIADGVNVDSSDSAGATALHWAVVKRDTKCVGLLVAAGASLDSRDNRGLTPILQAAMSEDMSCARLLVNAGATIGDVDETGRGFVHWGSMSAGDHDIADIERFMLFAVEQGLDINQMDVQGLTALDYAETHGHEDIANLLVGMGGATGEDLRIKR